MVVAEEEAIRSEELADAGAELAAEGLAELAAAAATREVSEELAAGGVAQVARGAADIGAAEALHATAEAVEARADESGDEGEAG
jgi:hypothetical protein